MNNGEKIKSRFIDLWEKTKSIASQRFDGKKGSELVEAIVIYVCRGLLSSAYAFLLSCCSTLFSSYPLGIAFLGAADTNVIFKYIGCIFAAFTLGKYKNLYLIAYTGVLGLRYVISKWLSDKDARAFSEDISVRAVVSAIAAFCIGVFVCVGERFTLHSLGALIFGCGICLCLGFIFSGYSNPKSTLHFSCAEYALAFCLIYSISKYSIFGFSLGFTLCTVISLYSSVKRDLFSSTVISLVSGLACNNPVLAPMFALIALVSGVVRKINRKLSIASGIIVGIVYSVWMFEERAFLYVLPDIICGCLIMVPIMHYQQSKQGAKSEIEGLYSDHIERERMLSSASKGDALRISSSIDSLARILEELSKSTKTPFYSDVKKMSIQVYEEHCSDCEMPCAYQSGEKCEDVICRISNCIFESGYVKKEDLPRNFFDKCPKGRELVKKSNREYGKLLERFMTDNNSRAFSCSYFSIAKLISEGVEKREEEFYVDEALSVNLKNEAQAMKLRCEDIYLIGKRRKTVLCEGMQDGALGISAAKLIERFSAIIDTPLGAPFIQSEGERWKMKMESLPIIKVQIAVATRICDGEEVCGDCITHFNSHDGYFYTVLSDGMGSGVEAALVSRICCAFTEKLLECGGSVKTVIETINGYILNQNFECSATLDLLKIDTYTSRASFIKSGAVSSMVVRGGHVFRINSSSVPVGVVRHLNTEVISLPVEDGDYIIMNSDGVAPDFEGVLYAADIVTGRGDLDIDEMAELIMDKAQNKTERPDDMSLAVIKISKS